MLEKQINEDLKTALKQGDKTRVSSLRLLINEMKNKMINERIDSLDDAKVISLIQKMAKMHEESIEKFKEGKRDDLVKKETDELEALKPYLPKQISESELTEIVKLSISSSGAKSPKDMGTVMKDVMSKTAGRADGKVISKIVKELLEREGNK